MSQTIAVPGVLIARPWTQAQLIYAHASIEFLLECVAVKRALAPLGSTVEQIKASTKLDDERVMRALNQLKLAGMARNAPPQLICRPDVPRHWARLWRLA